MLTLNNNIIKVCLKIIYYYIVLLISFLTKKSVIWRTFIQSKYIELYVILINRRMFIEFLNLFSFILPHKKYQLCLQLIFTCAMCICSRLSSKEKQYKIDSIPVFFLFSIVTCLFYGNSVRDTSNCYLNFLFRENVHRIVEFLFFHVVNCFKINIP